MDIILYPLRFVLPIMFFLFFYSSIIRIVQNLFHLFTYDSGIIVDYANIDTSDGADPGYLIKEILNNKIYMGQIDQKINAAIGDTVYFKNFHDSNITVFKLNQNEFTSKFDWLDYFSPIITLIIGWIYYKIYILPFYQKYFKKHDKI